MIKYEQKQFECYFTLVYSGDLEVPKSGLFDLIFGRLEWSIPVEGIPIKKGQISNGLVLKCWAIAKSYALTI